MTLKSLAAVAVLLISLVPVCGGADDAKGTKGEAKKHRPDKAALEKEFAARLTGCTMVGRFDMEGRSETAKPAADRYDIESAEKVKGNRWRITARIKYGKQDVKIPIVLDVLWAGDTPVITLTDLTVPTLGTFTARVMVYGDRYAGTWQHGKVGGHMWGMIERTAAAEHGAK